MNATQAAHIFWKEYRTQRALWLAMVLLFLGTAVLTVLFLPERNQPDVSSLVSSGFVTVTFYLLASTSILYASEKEQDTDVLLRTLPANPWLMLGAKSAWVLLSSLVAIGIFSLSAYLLADPGHVVGDDLGYAVGVIAYVFCCTLVVSLLTRHVLSAIGISVVLVFAFPILGEFIDHQFVSLTDRGWNAYFTIVTVLLLLTSVEVNRRWFRESDWTLPRGIRFGRAMTLQSAMQLPLELEGPGRVWRRHLWREWHSLRVWLVGIAVFAILLTTWLYQTHSAAETKFALFAITLVIIPLLFGIGSCRGDQAHERFLSLGRRGESSFRLLLAKHALWIGSCALLIISFQLFIWPDYRQMASHRAAEFAGSLRFIPFRSGLMSSSRLEELSGSLIPGIQFCAGIALLLYCLGHFFSLLIRQPVLSLAVSFFSGIFVTFLVCLFYALNVPLFLLTVVPAAGLLGLSFYRGRDWITGNRSWESWKRLAWWSVLGLWTLVTLMATWRVAEIPFAMRIDRTGLNNIPTYYLAGCAIGLVAAFLFLSLADWIRRYLSDSSGRSVLRAGRWCTLTGLIGTFLVGHNLWLTASSVASHQQTSKLAVPMSLAVHNDIAERKEFEETAGDLYQIADEKITSSFPLPAEMLWRDEDRQQRRHLNELRRLKSYYRWNSWNDVTAEQRLWLEQHQHILPLFFEADRAGVVESKVMETRKKGSQVDFYGSPHGFLINTRTESYLDLISLARLQALQLEHEGRLADAWQHHLAVVRYARRFAHDNFPSARGDVLSWLNTVMFSGDLWRWQARREQTPELLARAAADLHQQLIQLSPLAEAYERRGGWALQFVESLSTMELIVHEDLLAALPWERQRLRTLIVEQSHLAAELARQIDEGFVRQVDSRWVYDDYERVFQFPKDVGGLSDCAVYLGLDRKSEVPEFGPHPTGPHAVLLSNHDFSFVHGHPAFFRDLQIQELAIHEKAETTTLLMRAPQRVLSLMVQPVEYSFQAELDFWHGLDTWIADCVIYSYRAETEQFPSHLGELEDAVQTWQRFAANMPSLTVNRGAPLSHDRRAKVNTALSPQRTRFGPESSAFRYQWFHASKWQQPEYNFGETPDRKPAAPLQAPKPEEVQP